MGSGTLIWSSNGGADSAALEALPITERRSGGSLNFDIMRTADAIQLCRDYDLQIFDGGADGTGLHGCADELAELAAELATGRRRGNINALCLTGTGTSGRLSYVVSAIARRQFPGSDFVRYNLNGGIGAIFGSRPGLEDRFDKGVNEVIASAAEDRRKALIGTSCGLSAPYVAGQLMTACETFVGPVVALGCNPPNLARKDKPVIGLSFAETIEQCRANPAFRTISTVVSPELLAGSVRLKGGSATLLALGAVSLATLTASTGSIAVTSTFISRLFEDAQEAIIGLYERNADRLEELVHEYLACLRRNGSIHIFGCGLMGLMGVTDAAECPPTFGIGFERVLGYCEEAALDVGVSANLDCSPLSGAAYVSGRYARLAKQAGRDDLAILLGRPYDAAFSACMQRSISFDVAVGGVAPDLVRCLETKLFLNVLSTIAFTQYGRVYSNIMVGLRISNSKLFKRGIRIVSSMTGTSESMAFEMVLRAIYLTEDVEGYKERPEAEHVIAAAERGGAVVPMAIMLSNDPSLSVRQVADVVARGNPIRRATQVA